MRGWRLRRILTVGRVWFGGCAMAKPKARRNGAARKAGRARSKRGSSPRAGLRGRIASDPGVCSGKPCVRGTRIPVHIILDLLAADESVENIIAAYPNISRDDVRACILHAAELAEEEAGVSS